MDLVAVARIGKPRGVRGEVWVDLFWKALPGLRAGGTVWVDSGGGPRAAAVEEFFEYSKGSVLKLEGVDKPEAAKELCGLELFMPSGEVPAEGPDDFDTEEVVGYEVRDDGRGRLGTVASVSSGPAYWTFHVRAAGAEFEIPAVKGLGVRLDKVARRVDVDLPEGYPGLPGSR